MPCAAAPASSCARRPAPARPRACRRALLDAGLAGDERGAGARAAAARGARRGAARRRGARRPRRRRGRLRGALRAASAARRRALRFVTEGVLAPPARARSVARAASAWSCSTSSTSATSQGDLALALVRELQATARPDLRLVVMSATLEPRRRRAFLGDCPVLAAEGRTFPVAIELRRRARRPRRSRRRSPPRCGALARTASTATCWCSCPAPARSAAPREALAPLAAAHDLLVLPLHGDLPPDEQDRAVRRAGAAQGDPGDQRRRDLAHDRRRGGGDRQRPGAHRAPLAVDAGSTLRLGAPISRAAASSAPAAPAAPRRAAACACDRGTITTRAASARCPRSAALDLARTRARAARLGPARSDARSRWFEPPPPAALGARRASCWRGSARSTRPSGDAHRARPPHARGSRRPAARAPAARGRAPRARRARARCSRRCRPSATSASTRAPSAASARATSDRRPPTCCCAPSCSTRRRAPVSTPARCAAAVSTPRAVRAVERTRRQRAVARAHARRRQGAAPSAPARRGGRCRRDANGAPALHPRRLSRPRRPPACRPARRAA